MRGLKWRVAFYLFVSFASHPSRGAWIEMLCVQHWRGCPVVFWRVVWYLRGRDRINVVPVRRGCGRRVASRTSHPPCRGRDVAARFLCRRRTVATRRWTIVFAMVYVVSVLSWFAI